jgi:stage II sporulation protein R
MDEEAMNQLKEGLGNNNYRLITDITEDNNAPVKIKFRIVEIVEDSKIRIAEIINNLF